MHGCVPHGKVACRFQVTFLMHESKSRFNYSKIWHTHHAHNNFPFLLRWHNPFFPFSSLIFQISWAIFPSWPLQMVDPCLALLQPHLSVLSFLQLPEHRLVLPGQHAGVFLQRRSWNGLNNHSFVWNALVDLLPKSFAVNPTQAESTTTCPQPSVGPSLGRLTSRKNVYWPSRAGLGKVTWLSFMTSEQRSRESVWCIVFLLSISNVVFQQYWRIT